MTTVSYAAPVNHGGRRHRRLQLDDLNAVATYGASLRGWAKASWAALYPEIQTILRGVSRIQRRRIEFPPNMNNMPTAPTSLRSYKEAIPATNLAGVSTTQTTQSVSPNITIAVLGHPTYNDVPPTTPGPPSRKS